MTALNVFTTRLQPKQSTEVFVVVVLAYRVLVGLDGAAKIGWRVVQGTEDDCCANTEVESRSGGINNDTKQMVKAIFAHTNTPKKGCSIHSSSMQFCLAHYYMPPKYSELFCQRG